MCRLQEGIVKKTEEEERRRREGRQASGIT